MIVPGAVEDGPLDDGVRKVCSSQVGCAAEGIEAAPGMAEICSDEPRAFERRAAQVGAAQDGAREICSLTQCPVERSARQVCVRKTRFL